MSCPESSLHALAAGSRRLFVLAASAALVLAAAGGCAELPPGGFVAPLVFVGTLESETLINNAPRECAHGSERSDLDEVCISNACGIGEAVFKVEQILAGAYDGSRSVLRYTIGEWCEPEFFGAQDRLLVCVSQAQDGRHSFRAQPIYPTAEGDVILPYETPHLGNLELEPLFRPLSEAIPYLSVADLPRERIDVLVSDGRLILDGETAGATQGVFLTDLARSLASGSWKPRALLLQRDELGGFTELTAVPTADGGPAVPDNRSTLTFFEC